MSADGIGGRVYDPVARRLHWLNAILALVTIMLAWGIVGATRHSAARPWLIVLHGRGTFVAHPGQGA